MNRRLRRKTRHKNSKDMRKIIEKDGIDTVLDNLIKESEMNDTEENREWLKNYIKGIAYR